MGENIDKLRGKAKQNVGKAIGNRQMEGEGVALQGRGVVRGLVKDAKRILKRNRR